MGRAGERRLPAFSEEACHPPPVTCLTFPGALGDLPRTKYGERCEWPLASRWTCCQPCAPHAPLRRERVRPADIRRGRGPSHYRGRPSDLRARAARRARGSVGGDARATTARLKV